MVKFYKHLNQDTNQIHPIMPVFLTCVCCKVMEHIVLCHLNRFLAVDNISTGLQHGFMRGFSCETQLIVTIHDWASVLNKKSGCNSFGFLQGIWHGVTSQTVTQIALVCHTKKVKLWTGSKLFSLTAFSLFQ